MTAATVALAVLAALLVVGALPRLRRRLRHHAVGTARMVDPATGDLCLHEVCSCHAARPCGDKHWSPRLHSITAHALSERH